MGNGVKLTCYLSKKRPLSLKEARKHIEGGYFEPDFVVMPVVATCQSQLI